MASTLYGENVQQYSDMIGVTIKLFVNICAAYDYSSFGPYNEISPLYFILFMVLFVLFLLNMLVAIIIAHYTEYNFQIQALHSNKDEQEMNFFTQIFQGIKENIAPDKYKYSGRKVKRFWFKVWDKLEKLIIKQKDTFHEIDLERLKHQLKGKFEVPLYGRQDISPFMQPYMRPNDLFEDLDLDEDDLVNSKDGLPSQMKMEEIMKKKKKMWREMGNIDAKNFRILQVGVFPEECRNDLEQLTVANTWAAALEEELFIASNYKVLYTDFLDYDDKFFRTEIVKTHDLEDFNNYQATFLSLNEVERIECWKKANSQQKFKLWEILDFEKIIDDTNAIKNDDNLEKFIEYMNNALKGRQNHQSKPIISFKRIIKSPEYSFLEYSRASSFQKLLWDNYTLQKDKFNMWFQLFTPYYRTKLWNKLQFSEEYVMHIINSPQLTRKDLVQLVQKKMSAVRNQYVDQLIQEIEELKKQKHNIVDLFSRVQKYSEINLQISQIELQINQIIQRKKKLVDIVKEAPQNIRDQYFNCEFYEEVWQLLKEKHYEEKVINPLYMKYNTVEFEKEVELLKNPNKNNINLNNLELIDKLDFQEEKDLEMKYTGEPFELVKSKKFDPFKKYGISVKKMVTEVSSSKTDLKISVKPDNQALKQLRSTSAQSIRFDNIPNIPLPTLVSQTSEPTQLRVHFDTNQKLNTDFQQIETEADGMLSDRVMIKTNNATLASTKSNLKQPTVAQTIESELEQKLKRPLRRKLVEQKFITQKVKINRQVHEKSLKRMFQLMVGGSDGQRMKNLKQQCQQRIDHLLFNTNYKGDLSDQEVKKDFEHIFKYSILTEQLDYTEQRLALWLPLSLEEKLKMLAAEHIESEAEMMMMLILEEIDWQDRGIHSIAQLDVMLERALDNLIYEKYQHYTQLQASEFVNRKVQQALKHQMKIDRDLIEYVAFLQRMYVRMGNTTSTAVKNLNRLKEHNRRIEERIRWRREDYNSPKKKQKDKEEEIDDEEYQIMKDFVKEQNKKAVAFKE